MDRGFRSVLSSWSTSSMTLPYASVSTIESQSNVQGGVPLKSGYYTSKGILEEDSTKSRHARIPSISTISPSTATTATRSQISWLAIYFVTNLSLTLYNKFVLVRFPFPYTLTALHALCGSIGGYVLQERGLFEPRALTASENAVLAAFSVLYTVNIAVSNLSLGLVTVPVSADLPLFLG